MAISEFSIIERFFTRTSHSREDVRLGVGDDAALLDVPAGMELVNCIDTLVAGVHFPEATSAVDIGYKALAVNLSDLAAMGAEPAWATLALTLPDVDEAWLDGFVRGFFELADRFNLALVGGDTTRGPLTVTVQANGFVPQGQALLRAGAQAGDHVFVTGTLGDAALGLRLLQLDILPTTDAEKYLRNRLQRPEPRVALGQALRGLASAAIDISDGLLADLGHLLEAGGLGAEINIAEIPLSSAFKNGVNGETATELALTGGDDYELCFTAPLKHIDAVKVACTANGIPCTDIGRIKEEQGLYCIDANGHGHEVMAKGYQHFDS